jgi:hypothetical protein
MHGASHSGSYSRRRALLIAMRSVGILAAEPQANDPDGDYSGVVWHIRKLSRRPRWLGAINQASTKFSIGVFYESVFSDAR